jgi:hypothetical protein
MQRMMGWGQFPVTPQPTTFVSAALLGITSLTRALHQSSE